MDDLLIPVLNPLCCIPISIKLYEKVAWNKYIETLHYSMSCVPLVMCNWHCIEGTIHELINSFSQKNLQTVLLINVRGSWLIFISVQGRRNVWGHKDWSSPCFQDSVNPISTRGADYAHHSTTVLTMLRYVPAALVYHFINKP